MFSGGFYISEISFNALKSVESNIVIDLEDEKTLIAGNLLNIQLNLLELTNKD